MLGLGRDGMVMEAFFAKQPAALKVLMPAIAEDLALAGAAFNTEQHVYTALFPLQGTCSQTCFACTCLQRHLFSKTHPSSGCAGSIAGDIIPRFLGDGLLDDESGSLYRFLALER